MYLHISKCLLLIPGRSDWTGEQWAKIVLQAWQIANWGLPTVIISDRDTRFTGGFWKTVFEALQVSLLYSTAYHAQTDGQSERTNQTIEIMIPFWCSTNPAKNWEKQLPSFQAILNASVNYATTTTPQELLYGFQPRQPWHVAGTDGRPQDFTIRSDAHQALAYGIRQASGCP